MATTGTFLLAAPGHWNSKRLAAAVVIALALQSLVLPCLCDVGRAKMVFAVVFDLLIAVRAGMAYLARERGSGWKFYAWLLGASPLWIEAVAYLILGEV
ncbi:MAG: hypothetical protein L0Y58_14405 [Verrucomicrobia subdivision 3 bacterium]|nr:hypothetical protein [Limisphaerales bacterium]